MASSHDDLYSSVTSQPMDEQRTRPGSCISVWLAAEFRRLALVQLPCMELTMITGLQGTG